MCETLEHLNFNPLPVIQEIHRVLKRGGLFYCALPNIASRGNRLKLLEGKSIHNPIAEFLNSCGPRAIQPSVCTGANILQQKSLRC